MKTWSRAVCSAALVALPLLATAGCKDVTVNQSAGRDAKYCKESECPGDSSSDASPSEGPTHTAAEDSSSDSPSETPSDGGSGSGGSGGADEGEAASAAPVSVLLSGSEVPYDMKASTDGDSGGIRTDWGAEDVTIGNQTFSSAFVARCSIACYGDDAAYFQVKLAGKYSLFDGSFGIAADSPANDKTHTLQVSISDQGTGHNLKSFTLKYGAVVPVKRLNVSHVGMLRIRFYGQLGDMHGAVGAPTVRQ